MTTTRIGNLIAKATDGKIVHEGYRRLTRVADPRPLVYPEKERLWNEVRPEYREPISQCCQGDPTGKGWPLFLHGPAGNGKTCAALSLLDYCGSSMYAPLSEWVTKLGEAKRGELFEQNMQCRWKVSTEVIRQRYRDAPLAVIDELGERTQPSDFEKEMLKMALDVREHQPTIFVSNLSLAELLAVYGDRIRNRLGAGTQVKFGDEDRRSKG